MIGIPCGGEEARFTLVFAIFSKGFKMTAVEAPSHGGKRVHAGRVGNVDYQTEKARLTREQADRVALQNKIASGEYVPRSAYRQAAATLIATFAQTVRSTPDNLERKLDLAPEVAEALTLELDAAMAHLAEGLRLLCDG